MSFKTTRPLNKINNNGVAGSTITVECPIGLTYHQIYFDLLGAWTLVDIDEMRLVLNGEIVQRWARSTAPALSGGEVMDLTSQFNGSVPFSTTVTWDFDRHNLLTRQGQEVSAVGTGLTPNVAAQLMAAAAAQGVQIQIAPDPQPVTNMTLEIDIAAGAGVGSLNNFRASQSDPSAVGITKVVRAFNYEPTGAGDYEITDLPLGALINKIYILGDDGGNIPFSRCIMEIDNFKAFDRTPDLNDRINVDGVRVPQPNLFVIDPTEQGFSSDGITTAGISELVIRLTMTSASQLLCLVEYLDAPKL